MYIMSLKQSKSVVSCLGRQVAPI
eukprot:COSAG01_NODE_46962_length_395_cov_0.675676_1_plen_23_part_01